jgi:hypothetical protein
MRVNARATPALSRMTVFVVAIHSSVTVVKTKKIPSRPNGAKVLGISMDFVVAADIYAAFADLSGPA